MQRGEMAITGVERRVFIWLLMSVIALEISADSTRHVRFLERTINEYKSYSDMEIMVVTVPELTQAMDVFLDLEAVHTANCKTLSIEVYYQYGAPPLPPMQTFPNDTYLTRTCAGSEARTLDNKKPLPFKGALPGQWFIGVLVPQSNGVKRISDLGFGNLTTHGCSFKVKMSATLTIATTALFIPSNGEQIGDSLPRGVNTKYYQYQHTRKSSMLTLSISGCYLVKEDGSRVIGVCPLTLAIRGKALPIQRDSLSLDCFSKDPCAITIPTPEQEQLSYYITTTRIPHELGGSIYYNISISLGECSDTWPNSLRDTRLDPGCVPVQKMFSVTTGKVLNKMFYPNRWNSSISLSSSGNPVFFSVPIPPSHVGSMLNVHAAYDIFSGRGVRLCLQKDAPAGFYRGYYEDDYQMNCTGQERLLQEIGGVGNVDMVVPFPEAGTWYISVYQLHSDDYKRFTIQLYAEIQGCINDCNQNGNCLINTKPDLVYGTCTCDTGYTGWACEKDVDVDLVSVCLLCLSNLAFIADVVISARLRLFPEMIVYIFLTIMSTLYHLCKTHIVCTMDGSFLQLCDFYAIALSLWVTLVAMTSLSNASYTATLNMVAVLVLFVSVVTARESILPFVLTVVIGFTLVVLYHVIMWCRGKPSASFSKKRWALFILPASILVTLSFLIFALFETIDQYKYLHSLGHVFLGIGIALLLPNHRHRISHFDISRQLSEETRAQPVNSRTPLLIGQVRHV